LLNRHPIGNLKTYIKGFAQINTVFGKPDEVVVTEIDIATNNITYDA